MVAVNREDPQAPVRLYLLRHGEVLSHRGDIPFSEDAAERAHEVGMALGREESGAFAVLSEETRRATEVADVDHLDFFPEFISSEDRVGWWLRHDDPPGDDARTVAMRMRSFAKSLRNPRMPERSVVVAVTHSPVLRAVGLDALGRDVGEPGWVSGFIVDVDSSGALTTSVFPG